MATQKLPKARPASPLLREFAAEIASGISPKAIDRHKAPQAERDIANYWAELYRQAQQSPDKRIRLQNGLVVAANDTEFLINLLENFGKYGTFIVRPPEGMSDAIALLRISLISQSLVNQGMSKKEFEQAAVKEVGSLSTIRRIRERVLGRHPNEIKKKSEKAERLKARRQGRLTPLEDAFGIHHPKKSKDTE